MKPEMVVRYCYLLAAPIMVACLFVGGVTTYKAWRFDQGFEKAYEIHKAIQSGTVPLDDLKSRIDHDWLDWIEHSAGWSGKLFADLQRGPTAGQLGSVVVDPPLHFERDLRRIVIGRGWLWSGILFSTASLLFIIPPSLQFISRRRRACCTRCGYDLRHLSNPRCPECGKPFPTEPGSGQTPSILVFPNHQRLVASMPTLTASIIGIGLIASSIPWLHREYEVNRRIAQYQELLTRSDADANVLVPQVMADEKVLHSLEGRRMLLSVVARPDVQADTRFTLATAMIDNMSYGIERLLMRMFESTADAKERMRIVEALRNAVGSVDVGPFLARHFPHVSDTALRIAIANWFGEHDSYWDFRGVLKGFFVREDHPLVKVAIAETIRPYESQFAEMWLQEMSQKHRNDTDRTIFEACQSALEDVE